MKIKDVKTAFKIADVVLDEEHPKNYIKFKYVENLVDENGKKLDKSVLTTRAGFVYIIVVNGEIKKLGGSQGKGGPKSTMNFYQGAMQGGPSIRSYGIHLLIKKELEKGKKVEFYIILSKEAKAEIKGLFEAHKENIVAYKEMEEKCNEDYKSVAGEYPEWHFQSRGKGKGYRWAKWIRRKYENYRAKYANTKKKSKKV